MPPIFYRVLCGLLLVIATFGFLAELSGQRISHGVANADKIAHFAIFFVLTWVFHKGFRPVFWRLFLILAVYGGLIELVQAFFTQRSGEWFDWFADLAGIIAFYLLRQLWHLCRPRRKVAQ